MISKVSILFVFFSFSIICSSQSVEINKKKIDSLVTLKKQMINNNELKSFYTIQLFSGNRNNAENVKKDYDTKNLEFKATIKYETPNYKVWVGMFRTKLYADKAYEKIKLSYPSALILRPGR